MSLSLDGSHDVRLEFAGHTTTTHYYDEGTGPVLLLVHGSGPGVSAEANWGERTIPHFANRFRVIAPDMIGFASSPAPESLELGPATWVAQLRSLLEALGIDRCSIIGNSFGGALAMRLGLQHPGLVDRQVLMGPIGTEFPITPALDSAWGYVESTPERMRAQLLDFVSNPSLITESLVATRHAAAIEPGILAAYARMFPEPRQRWIKDLALTDDELRSVAPETLILHGRDDRIIPLSSSERMVSMIQNVQLHVFGRCGHWVQIEQAERFNAQVDAFFSG